MYWLYVLVVCISSMCMYYVYVYVLVIFTSCMYWLYVQGVYDSYVLVVCTSVCTSSLN